MAGLNTGWGKVATGPQAPTPGSSTSTGRLPLGTGGGTGAAKKAKAAGQKKAMLGGLR